MVAKLLFGELSGKKAGPFRWIFDRRLLLHVWEWQAFQAEPWMRSILASAAAVASDQLPDDQVCFVGGLWDRRGHFTRSSLDTVQVELWITDAMITEQILSRRPVVNKSMFAAVRESTRALSGVWQMGFQSESVPSDGNRRKPSRNVLFGVAKPARTTPLSASRANGVDMAGVTTDQWRSGVDRLEPTNTQEVSFLDDGNKRPVTPSTLIMEIGDQATSHSSKEADLSLPNCIVP